MEEFDYNLSVFINCPFTEDYEPLFNAILFAVVFCGYTPRSAMEVVDAGQVRIDKILDIISDCRFGIHDISNMELDANSGLPRFNMVFELGLFLGALRFDSPKKKKKHTAIFDKEKYRYMKSISDISGQDIQSHNGEPKKIIKCVRDWLDSHRERLEDKLPGPISIFNRYEQYILDLPKIFNQLGLDYGDLTFSDKWECISEWMITTKAR